ncbi:MAG: sodium:proton antiporter [Lachnospiraceae bacterium]|nr:sodium:proton antiporter [Lachnospiraceae bacterium]
MEFVRNFPFFSILLPMISGPISSVISGKKAKRINFAVVLVSGLLSVATLVYVLNTGAAYTYRMGAFPAPFGNEIRVGVLEALTASFFCFVMLLSIIGGYRFTAVDVPEDKQNLYYIMMNLLLSSLLALIYTNDMFTGYVFIEINTISACGLIMIRGWGRNLLAAIKYMIMSLLGSGLVLISLSILYGITGHLLMEQMHDSIVTIMAQGTYTEPLTVAVGLFCVGIAIKSALFPFHSWVPDAYGYSTCASSAILSSLVSKGYIFLLIKFFYRVIGTDIIHQIQVDDVLFVFGIAGMVFGSVSAIQQTDVSRMIAFSSVAQIGYIYMGFGLNTEAGMIASIFHILAHAAGKSMLFISLNSLSDGTWEYENYRKLRGAAYRHRIAGLGFAVGSLSMVGIPLLAGFTSKVYFAKAAFGVDSSPKMLIALIALAISTILNAMYFIGQMINIYTPLVVEPEPGIVRHATATRVAVILFIIVNFVLGMGSEPVFRWIQTGLSQFR